jgi:hypothetical protein
MQVIEAIHAGASDVSLNTQAVRNEINEVGARAVAL